MNDALEVDVSFNQDGSEIEEIRVTRLRLNDYRIEENPIFTQKVGYGDIVRLEERNGVYYYMATVTPSGLKRRSWLLSEQVAASRELAYFTARVAEIGGRTELVFGGYLIVNLPADAPFDPDEEIRLIHEQVERGQT